LPRFNLFYDSIKATLGLSYAQQYWRISQQFYCATQCKRGNLTRPLCLSVRLFVCLSITLMSRVKMAKCIVQLFSIGIAMSFCIIFSCHKQQRNYHTRHAQRRR